MKLRGSAYPWRDVIAALRATTGTAPPPSVSRIADDGANPFHILISTMISLRTRDEVTAAASDRLFARASTPSDICRLNTEEIAGLIFPAGFYRTKAEHIKKVAAILEDQYEGAVPSTTEELVALPGVGLKTANLVLGLGFKIPAICVDTHVHRISNRLGWITTKTPEQSEKTLQGVIPKEFWIEINGLLVAFGQRICTPLSPRCSLCPFGDANDIPRCPRVGVSHFR